MASNNILNLDGSAHFDIEGVFDNTTWPDMELSHTDENGDPIELEGEWKMRVAPIENPDDITELTVDNGAIEVAGHVLTIKKHSSIELPSGNYDFQILCKLSDEVFIFYQGSLKINKTQPWDLAT
ncbi:hypothetical protein ACX0G7_09695 [Flavitalea antarctica]